VQLLVVGLGVGQHGELLEAEQALEAFVVQFRDFGRWGIRRRAGIEFLLRGTKEQGCQIFLGTKYQNGEKYTQ
jgi:hypothetical protein